MPQWEYKVLKYKIGEWRQSVPDYSEIERELNELGRLGWQVLNCVAPGRKMGQANELVAVLSRPRS